MTNYSTKEFTDSFNRLLGRTHVAKVGLIVVLQLVLKIRFLPAKLNQKST